MGVAVMRDLTPIILHVYVCSQWKLYMLNEFAEMLVLNFKWKRHKSIIFVFLHRTNVVMNYTEVESKVREATNDDPWGPSGQLMTEISK